MAEKLDIPEVEVDGRKLLRVVVGGRQYLAEEVLSISDGEVVIRDPLGNIVVIKRNGEKSQKPVDIVVAD